MKGFRKIALVAISATMLGTLAGPAFADRGDKDRGDGHGWRHEQMHGKAKWGGKRRHGHHGRHGGRMAMMFMEVFDTDGDGKLTQDEIDARRDELFAAADGRWRRPRHPRGIQGRLCRDDRDTEGSRLPADGP